MTKRFNPFVAENYGVKLGYVDILLSVENVTNCQITMLVYLNNESFATGIYTINCYKEDGSYYSGDMIWKRIYTNTCSDSVQLSFYLTNDQLYSSSGRAIIKIHALNLFMQKGSRITR
jgi:hypothetical protein